MSPAASTPPSPRGTCKSERIALGVGASRHSPLITSIRRAHKKRCGNDRRGILMGRVPTDKTVKGFLALVDLLPPPPSDATAPTLGSITLTL